MIAIRDPVLRRRLTMATAMLSSSMYSLDLTVVSVALPHMQGTFSAAPDQIAWVVTAFIVGATVTIATIGWLSSRFGRKRVFTFAILIFLPVSIMCGHVSVLEEEVALRMVLGLAGAAIIPLSQVIAVEAYPRERYGYALTLWSVGGIAGSIVAPPLAGIVIDLYGWPGVFYMNIPIGTLSLLGALFVVPREAPETARPLDVFGLLTLVIALGATQLALNRGPRLDWFSSTEIIIEVLAAGLCLYLFLAHSLTAVNPFLRPEPFEDRNYAVGVLGAFIYGMLWALPTVMVPLLLQNYRSVPVEMVGLLVMPRQLGYLIGSTLMGMAIQRVDPRLLAMSGFGSVAFSAWLMSGWSLDVNLWSIAWASILQGIGCAFAFISFNTLALSTISAEHRPQCVPLFYLIINLGSGVGVAGAVTYWANHTQSTRALLAEHVSPYNPLLHGPNVPGAWDVGTISGISALNQELTRQAGMIGYNDTFAIVMVAALVAASLAVLFRRVGARKA